MSIHADENRTAIVEDGAPVSYAELLREIDSRAAAAQQSGVGRGDLVGIAAPKSWQSIAAFFGIMQAGGCPCFVEPRLEAAALIQRMDAVGMDRLILAPDATLALADFRHVRAHPLEEFHSDVPPHPVDLAEHDRAMMLFTSGSTGNPKGVLLSHENLTVNAEGVVAMTGLTFRDRLLQVMPLHHTNAVNNQLIAPFIAGATVLIEPKFNAADTVQALRELQPTYLTGVPTMYSRMLDHVQPDEHFASLRFLRCGSAPISSSLHAQIEAAFGVPLVLSYGLSEATCTSTMNPPQQPRHGSVGKVLQDQQVKLFGPNSTRDVPEGGEGEICIGGPALMLGYIGTDAESPIQDGWLRTGDLGRFDQDGYLTITGRIKDVIIRGGENISPATIENVLCSHPDVEECCVVGEPNEDLGEVAVAFIRCASPDKTPSDEELNAHILQGLNRIYVPAKYVRIGSMPVNKVGKYDKKALKANLIPQP